MKTLDDFLDFLNDQGFDIDPKDDLWMEDYLTEHKFKDVFGMFQLFQKYQPSPPTVKESEPLEQEEMILLPKRLTAENGAKALLTGEFSQSIETEDEVLEVTISWSTIKEIYAKIVEHYGRK